MKGFVTFCLKKPTLLLLFFTALFIVTYFYKENAIVMMINHASGAAMIGGLADWYAVTALFDKPLGFISFRANVVPNKIKEVKMLVVDITTKELLTPKHIYSVIKDEQSVKKIILFLLSTEGKQYIADMLTTIKPKLRGFSWTPIFEDVIKSGVKGLEVWKITPVLVSLMKQFLADDGAQKIWVLVNRILCKVLKSPEIFPYLKDFVAASRRDYEEKSTMRSLVLKKILRFLDYTDENIARMIQKESICYLSSQEDRHTALAKQVHQLLENLVSKLETDEQWQERIEQLKFDILHNETIRTQIVAYMESDKKVEIFALVEEEMWKYLLALEHSEEKRNAVEDKLCGLVMFFLKGLKPTIENMIADKFEQYEANPHYLSKELKGKVHSDLQAIRVNGTLVGALIGALLGIMQMIMQMLIAAMRG